MVLKVNTSENTFVQVTQNKFNIDKLDQLKRVSKEQYAFMARVNDWTQEGSDSSICSDSQPKNYKDAMTCSDRQEWAAAMSKEYLGFKDMKALEIVKQPKGTRIP